MSVAIEQISPETILVNGKIIRQDMDGIWSCQSSMELTPPEQRAFNNYLKAIQDAKEE